MWAQCNLPMMMDTSIVSLMMISIVITEKYEVEAMMKGTGDLQGGCEVCREEGGVNFKVMKSDEKRPP